MARPPFDESVQGKAGRGGLPLLYVVKSMSTLVESLSPVSALRAGMGIGFLPSPTDGWKQVFVLAERGSSSHSCYRREALVLQTLVDAIHACRAFYPAFLTAFD